MASTVNIGAYSDALVVLGTAGMVVPILRRAGVNPILAYLGAGAVLGPLGLGSFVGSFPPLYWLTVTDAKNGQWQYVYDHNGNPTDITDPLLVVTHNTYDALDHLVDITNNIQSRVMAYVLGQPNLARKTWPLPRAECITLKAWSMTPPTRDFSWWTTAITPPRESPSGPG